MGLLDSIRELDSGSRFAKARPAPIGNGLMPQQFNNPQPRQAPQGMSNDDKSALALSLAGSFAGMSGNPNTNSIMAGIEGQKAAIAARREKAQAAELATNQSNATLNALRAAGVPEEVLAVARANPELAKAITTSYINAKMGKGGMLKFSGQQTDPKTGQLYTIMSNPNDGTSVRVDVENAVGQTPADKLSMENEADLYKQDVAKAKEVGQQSFGQMEKMQSDIRELSTARRLVVEEGAKAGVLQKYMPAFDAATAEFRVVANRLGIAVINSATFGALSETELKLALETGFPRDLSGDALIEWIDEKIRVQTKMSTALYNKARGLTSGITYSSFIQNHGKKDDDSGENLTEAQKEMKRRGLAY